MDEGDQQDPQQEAPAVPPGTPTAGLKFVDGVLHQLFIVNGEDGSARPEWFPVPSE